MFSLLLLAAAPVDTPPAPPPVTDSPYAEADCTVPARRAVILSGAKGTLGLPDKSAIDAYNQQMTERLNARMDALGMTTDERGAMASAMLSDPAFRKELDTTLTDLTAMFKDFGAVAKSKDPVANCRGIVRMRSHLGPMMDSARRQWAMFDAALDAEAARRGIAPAPAP